MALTLDGVGAASGGAFTYATLNPADKFNMTLSNGNLTAIPASNAAAFGAVRATKAITGDAYWEAHIDTYNNDPQVGLIDASFDITTMGTTSWVSTSNAHTAAWDPTLFRYQATTISHAITGNTARFAYKYSTQTLYIGDSTGWISCDPVAQTGGVVLSGMVGNPYPAFQGDFADQATFNFGQSAYVFTPPSGYGNV